MMIVPQHKHADKNMRRLFLLVVISLLFVGCINVRPNYQAPKLVAPAQFPNRQGNANGAVRLTRWWTSFHEAELDSLLAECFGNGSVMECSRQQYSRLGFADVDHRYQSAFGAVLSGRGRHAIGDLCTM
jgi:hypothetical protein